MQYSESSEGPPMSTLGLLGAAVTSVGADASLEGLPEASAALVAVAADAAASTLALALEAADALLAIVPFFRNGHVAPSGHLRPGVLLPFPLRMTSSEGCAPLCARDEERPLVFRSFSLAAVSLTLLPLAFALMADVPLASSPFPAVSRTAAPLEDAPFALVPLAASTAAASGGVWAAVALGAPLGLLGSSSPVARRRSSSFPLFALSAAKATWRIAPFSALISRSADLKRAFRSLHIQLTVTTSHEGHTKEEHVCSQGKRHCH